MAISNHDIDINISIECLDLDGNIGLERQGDNSSSCSSAAPINLNLTALDHSNIGHRIVRALHYQDNNGVLCNGK